MKWLLPLLISPLLFLAASTGAPAGDVAIILHGGAGGLKKGEVPAEKEAAIRAAIEEALQAGYTLLAKGGRSLDAVEAAIVLLEDNPSFNAGKGAVKTSEGRHELDASIMDGGKLKAGAVGGVTIVKNPIRAARAVMDKTWHVMLAGLGADAFAKENGLELVENGYFSVAAAQSKEPKSGYFGTVGAVALDKDGDIAAGTSTGGLSGKKYGRIGDSPIIGAGTYAENSTCGVSCTGQGEYFIRRAAAFDVAARMKYAGRPLEKSAKETLDTVTSDGGQGGIIGLDQKGNVVAEFNTSSMVRGWIGFDGVAHVAIFKGPEESETKKK